MEDTLNMNYKNKLFVTKKKAFTLIELLIVIAIIGILFIVLVSKVDFATDKSKATGVQTDFRSFQMAFDTVAKENAGFNTFGWDTGDTNANGKRDSYDKGDTNKDGKQDVGEVWTGHKVYDETFTKVYSLIKPGTTGYDRDALNRLETAINANLDPKLHITIKDDGEIVMANGAQDPWNKEYHGWYITNAETDGKDRGAIVMYSDGANNEFGSAHSIAGGKVSVTIPNSNKNGKDDYSLVSVYSYINGYGELLNSTTGFSNNLLANGNNNVVLIPGQGNQNETPEIVRDAGMYKTDGTFVSWQQLIDDEIIYVNNGILSTNVNMMSNSSAQYLIGELVIHNSVTSLDDSALYKCINLTSVILPDTIIDIGGFAFNECKAIQNIVVPNAVDNLAQFTFYDCYNLKSVTLSKNIKSIGECAFWQAYALTDIYYEGTIDEWNLITKEQYWDSTNNEGFTIHCSDGSVRAGSFME